MAWYVIAIIAAVIAAGASIVHYQFFYVQAINEKKQEVVSQWIAIPHSKAVVRILEGASLQSSPKFLEPQNATVILGINNTVLWMNEDNVPQAITSDSDYKDPVSGKFDTRERPEAAGGPFIMPRQTYEFTFTQPGRYGYHGEPHPWLQGTIIVLDAQ